MAKANPMTSAELNIMLNRSPVIQETAAFSLVSSGSLARTSKALQIKELMNNVLIIPKTH